MLRCGCYESNKSRRVLHFVLNYLNTTCKSCCLFCLQPSKKPKVDEVQELLTLYQPPDWLICTVNRISPFVPQIGDEVGLIPL